MGKAISITLEQDSLKNNKRVLLAVKVEETTKKQFDALRKHYNTNGKDLLTQIIGQVYNQIFQDEK